MAQPPDGVPLGLADNAAAAVPKGQARRSPGVCPPGLPGVLTARHVSRSDVFIKDGSGAPGNRPEIVVIHPLGPVPARIDAEDVHQALSGPGLQIQGGVTIPGGVVAHVGQHFDPRPLGALPVQPPAQFPHEGGDVGRPVPLQPLLCRRRIPPPLDRFGELAGIDPIGLLEIFNHRRLEQHKRRPAGIDQLHPLHSIAGQLRQQVHIETSYLAVGQAQPDNALALPIPAAPLRVLFPEMYGLEPDRRHGGHGSHAKTQVDFNAHGMGMIHGHLERIDAAGLKAAEALGGPPPGLHRKILLSGAHHRSHPAGIEGLAGADAPGSQEELPDIGAPQRLQVFLDVLYRPRTPMKGALPIHLRRQKPGLGTPAGPLILPDFFRGQRDQPHKGKLGHTGMAGLQVGDH